ncbi:cytochrome o ubiquinol oxidase subunit IV [Sphingopyxis sp. H050]|jgi:cytochrome o ubiquinol oxidase subunit IV|uniref:cytochrome o ubiquinol oxidase subunit IV n=1 Tax=Sphingopyxis sp. H050 TaxID=1759072 RepID=UPI000736F57B|nr:cytochrome o ubiquinol oxidase subunit IV [Sphingopyxis sp. H050]KTE20647.1 cytochrome o ubiquinol oxidase subunit IV [Sphingopyxis sp. H050]
MSADPHAAHGQVHGEIEMPHASMRDYLVGFVLSVILTAIPFWLVMERPLSTGATAAIIMILAAAQIVVHMVYFLHMTPKAEDGWSLTSLVFTVIVVVIMLAGSLWVMHHLNTNMMPQVHDTSQLP